MIDHLIARRIIRSLPVQEETIFELSHEYLVKKISAWMTEDEIKTKKILEMISNNLDHFQKMGISLGEEKLAIVRKEYEKGNIRFAETEKMLLLHSALYADSDIHFWGEQPSPTSVLKTLKRIFTQDNDLEIQARVLNALGVILNVSLRSRRD